MIKVFLENGDIVNCQEDFWNILSLMTKAQNAQKAFLGLVKTDGEGVIIPANKILRIEGPFRKMSDSEVETGPYSEDIIVD